MILRYFSALHALVLALCLGACSTIDYKDSSLSPEKRTEALLSQMTVEEKIGQMLCPLGWPMYEKIGTDSVTVSEAYKAFIGDLGDVMLMPYDPANVKIDTLGHVYADLKHENEAVRPGYYSIDMPEYGIKAELTATPRVGYHRYNAESDKLAVLVDLTTGVGWDAVSDAKLTNDGDRIITGYRRSEGWAKDQIYYFAAEFSQPFSTENPIDSCGVGVRRTLEFDLNDAPCLEVKVALSAVSEENALMNLNAELPEWNFDQIVENAEKAWNNELGRIEIEPMDEAQGRIFYTALYHTMIAPSLFCDVDNSYRGADGQVHQSTSPTYTILSLWDTYRAAMPLTTLIDGDRSAAMVNTYMNIYREQGKLPVWHLAGNETDCMVGNPGVVSLADLFMKGFVPEELKSEAVEAMRVSSMLDERGMEFLKEHGYIPFDKSAELETLAKCLEFAIAAPSSSVRYLIQCILTSSTASAEMRMWDRCLHGTSFLHSVFIRQILRRLSSSSEARM